MTPFRLAALLLLLAAPLRADPVAVNAATFVRAETHRYMAQIVARTGLGVVGHGRETTRVEDQPVVRMNMDTLYSSGVFDLSAGPVTVTLPEAAGRYVAVQPVSEDHFTDRVLHGGTTTITQDDIGTRYVALLVRVFVDPASPADIAAAHALQDAMRFDQPARGAWEVPDWDTASLDRTRQILLDLGAQGMQGFGPRMGPRGQVDAVGHLIATAGGWGLNPDGEAQYLSSFPARNDGRVVHRLVLRDVPVDGFWSVTVYDAAGYMPVAGEGRSAVNNVTAMAGADGAVTVQFGGCDGTVPNCLRILPGWNHVLRLYRPRPEVLDGGWTAPEALPIP